MAIRINEARLYRIDLDLRLPFRYGVATLTHLPHAFVRVEAEVDGVRRVGVSADHLPPKWFTKNPGRDVGEEIEELLLVLRHACDAAAGREADSAFALWRGLYEAQARWGAEQNLAPLLSNFGVTLIERALIEAVCRARGKPFAQLLRGGDLGVRPGSIHPALATRNFVDLLPAAPLDRITVRHTVGLSDPLEDAEVEGAANDGLPRSLSACIREYGLRHFKIKVSGDAASDADRLRRVAETIAAHAPADYAFSLDGNEGYRSPKDLRAFWNDLRADAELAPFLARLLFIEQPLHRDVALSPEVAPFLDDWPARPPLIIDESDATLESLPIALTLGYAGTSYKSCKGVFKGIANACLLELLRRERPDRPVLLTGEDLSNIGPVSLQQDLAVLATLGVRSVERNGHHYFAGLSQFPAEVQRQVLMAHPDLYHPSAQGWPTLTIREGEIALGSVLAAPFGAGFDLDVGQFTAVDPSPPSPLPQGGEGGL